MNGHGYARYSRYKDSGVEWLGEIPEGWRVLRLKQALEPGQSGSKMGPYGSALKLDTLANDGVKIYGQENVIYGDFSRGTRFLPDTNAQEFGSYRLKEGDLLVTMMGSAGRCRVFPGDVAGGIFDSHLVRLRVDAEDTIPPFAALVLDQADYVRQQMLSGGKEP